MFGSSEGPDYHAPAPDARGRRSIDTVTQGAMNSSAESERAAYQPSSTRGLLADDGSFDKGLGMDPTLAAVRGRSQRDFQHDENKLNADVKMNSRNSYFERLGKATELAAEENRMNFAREMAKRKAKEAKKQARGAMLGSVLGIVGGVAGTVFGGPAGGMVGAQAGGAIGQNVGQGM